MRLIESIKNKKVLLITPVVALALTIGVVAGQDTPARKDVVVTTSGSGTPVNNQDTPVDTVAQTNSATVKLNAGSETYTRVASAPVQNHATVEEEPVVEQEAPPEPPVVTVESKSSRKVDVSPEDKPQTRYEFYCDYSYNDGTTSSVFKGVVSKNISIDC